MRPYWYGVLWLKQTGSKGISLSIGGVASPGSGWPTSRLRPRSSQMGLKRNKRNMAKQNTNRKTGSGPREAARALFFEPRSRARAAPDAFFRLSEAAFLEQRYFGDMPLP